MTVQGGAKPRAKAKAPAQLVPVKMEVLDSDDEDAVSKGVAVPTAGAAVKAQTLKMLAQTDKPELENTPPGKKLQGRELEEAIDEAAKMLNKEGVAMSGWAPTAAGVSLPPPLPTSRI